MSAPESVTRRLEVLLQRTSKQRVEVLNAGVRGMGTGQELLLLRNEALRYHPDVVVLIFTTLNDVADNSPIFMPRNWPHFALGPRGELQQLPFEYRAQGPRRLDVLRRASLLFGVLESGLRLRLGANERVPEREYRLNTLPVYAVRSTQHWEEA